jgi:hypothetical protein
MTTQQETLTLAAQVVDQFSAPLRDLTKQLRAFSGLQQDTNVRGKRDVDRHWQSYRDLGKQVTETASVTKKLLQPAVEALGVTSLATLGSIAGVTAAVRAFGQSSETLGYLRTETGLTVQALRTLEAAGERVGISAGQTDSSLQKFAENLAQYKKGKGPFVEAMKGQSADMMAFFKSLADMPIGDAIAAIRRKMGSVKGQDRRLFARLIGIPEDFGRETDEIVARTEKFLGKLTDAQRASGEKMQQNWHDLKDAIQGASDTISADLAPALGAAYENLAKFVSEAPAVAAIAASLAGIGGLWGARTAVRGFLGLGGGAAAGAAGGAGLLGPGMLGLGAAGAGAAFLKLTEGDKLNRPEDLYKPGYGALTRHQKAIRGMLYGPQLPGTGEHNIKGSFADIAQNYRTEKSQYAATMQGAKEGILAAFQQLRNDPNFGLAGLGARGGLGGGAAGAGGGLGGIGGDGSPLGATGAPLGRAHAGQRAILGGHVKAAADAIRGMMGGGAGGGGNPILSAIDAATIGDPKTRQTLRNIYGGESGHGAHYDSNTNGEDSWGPFQLNRRGGLGALFEKENPGLSLKDPKTIGAQAKWVADYIRGHRGPLSQWQGLKHPERFGHLTGGYAPGAAALTVPGMADVRAALAAHPRFYGGTLAAGGQTFHYGTGSPYGGRGSSAYGDHPITGWDPAAHHGVGGGAFRIADQNDPNVPGGPRRQVEIHEGRTEELDKLYTAGCFAVPPSEWPRARAAIMQQLRGGHAVLRIGRDGNAAIVNSSGTQLTQSTESLRRSLTAPPRQGLDADIRQRPHAAHAVHALHGRASVDINLKGFPRGTKTAAKTEGIFKEVRLNRGRAVPIAES